MADASKLFTPPVNSITENEPMIERIDLKEMDWANRKSQQKPWRTNEVGSVKNLPNGR